jgi:hypothetical protein
MRYNTLIGGGVVYTYLRWVDFDISAYSVFSYAKPLYGVFFKSPWKGFAIIY